MRDLEEEIEEIKTELKSLKRDKKSLEAQNDLLRKHFPENSSQLIENKRNMDKSISRRNFIKKLGIGALAIGATGLSGASSLKLSKNALEAETTSSNVVESKVVNGRVYAAHPDFSTLQEALDFADNNSYDVVEAPGDASYSEQVVVPSGTRLVGQAFGSYGPEINAGTSGTEITLNTRSSVENFRVAAAYSDTSTGNADSIEVVGNGACVKNCYIRGAGNHGIYTNNPLLKVSGVICNSPSYFGGNIVYLDSGTDRCVITNNPRIYGDLSNNGANNVVSNNS